MSRCVGGGISRETAPLGQPVSRNPYRPSNLACQALVHLNDSTGHQQVAAIGHPDCCGGTPVADTTFFRSGWQLTPNSPARPDVACKRALCLC
jgi:hypothetical protein